MTRWPLSPSFILLIHFYFGCKCNTLPPSLASTPHTDRQCELISLSEFDYICSHFMMPLDLTNKTSSLNQMDHLVLQQVQTCKKNKQTSYWFSCKNNLLPAVAFFSRWAVELGKKNKIKAGSIARPFLHTYTFPIRVGLKVKSPPLLVLRPHLPLSRIHKSYIPASNRRQQSFQSYGKKKNSKQKNDGRL